MGRNEPAGIGWGPEAARSPHWCPRCESLTRVDGCHGRQATHHGCAVCGWCPDCETVIPWEYLRANLVTQAQIARRLQIDDANITNWKRRPDWPPPVMTFPRWGPGSGDLFWWPDVQAFCGRHNVARGRGMRRGRPPKNRPQPLPPSN